MPLSDLPQLGGLFEPSLWPDPGVPDYFCVPTPLAQFRPNMVLSFH